MANQIIFITGTDTGVGKTVVAARLTRRLRERGVEAVALKPICSGGREDAVSLRDAAQRTLSLDEVNRWHFRAALSPLLAARREKKRVKPGDVVAQIQDAQRRFEVVIVEGAGGLLSPLGEGFDSRTLLTACDARAIVVCPNRLGAVGQLRLTLEALPSGRTRRRAHCVLVDPPRTEPAARSNRELLEEFVDATRLHEFPWITQRAARTADRRIKRCLDRLLDLIG